MSYYTSDEDRYGEEVMYFSDQPIDDPLSVLYDIDEYQIDSWLFERLERALKADPYNRKRVKDVLDLGERDGLISDDALKTMRGIC